MSNRKGIGLHADTTPAIDATGKVSQGQSVKGPRVLFVDVWTTNKVVGNSEGRKAGQKVWIVGLDELNRLSGQFPAGLVLFDLGEGLCSTTAQQAQSFLLYLGLCWSPQDKIGCCLDRWSRVDIALFLSPGPQFFQEGFA